MSSDEDDDENHFPDDLISIEIDLAYRLTRFDYGPKVSYSYNPLEYAYDVHITFVKRFCRTPKEILFLGMNPGPWGMMQNGVIIIIF